MGHVPRGSVLPGTWLGLQVRRCCCTAARIRAALGSFDPTSHGSLCLPGAAEKPYMVEEAVSYNELDYISVSAARVGSALLGGSRR